MKNKFLTILSFVSLSLIFAQETDTKLSKTDDSEYKPRLYLGIQVGTLGGGLQLGIPITKMIDVRLSGSMIRPKSRNITSKEDGVDVKSMLEFKSSSGSLIFDFSLSKNKPGIKLAAGAFYNNISLNVDRSYYHSTYEIDLGNLEMNFTNKNKINPYLGMVFGNFKKSKSMFFVFEMGMIYHGSPKLNFTGEGRISPTANESNTQAIENNVSSVKFYPYVNMQLNFYLTKKKN
jgi:hypothetical protein